MRMTSRPGDLGRDGIRGGDHPPDLQPSEDDVKCRLTTHEAELPRRMFGTSKGSEEHKQVARADCIASEMTLRCAGLAKDRTPTGGACDRIASQIGIEMRTVASANSASRQILGKLRD